MNRSFTRTAARAVLSVVATSAVFIALGCQSAPTPAASTDTSAAPSPAKPAAGSFHSANNMLPANQRKDLPPTQ
ncbi:MAG TPA: hypothetical protein VGC07_09890 [Granulicella sp.]